MLVLGMELAVPRGMREKPPTVYTVPTYHTFHLFGEDARAWLRANESTFGDSDYGRLRYWRAEGAVEDGWGLEIGQGRWNGAGYCSHVACPRCGHTLRLNQHTWKMRHENKCGIPTRSKIATAISNAFNVFSIPLELNTLDHHLRAGAIRRALRAFHK